VEAYLRMRERAAVLAVAVCYFSLACSGEGPAPGDATDEDLSHPLPAAIPAFPDAGAIQGRVVFQGEEVPRSTLVRNTTDPHECGEVQSLRNILVSRNHGIVNTVISLANVSLPPDYEVPTSTLVLDNRGCQFEPHVAVLTTGSSIATTNSDAITHTVHLYGLFNLNVALGPGQSKSVRRLDRPGWYIVKCDLHGWMQAYLRVDEHPFHTVSSSDGSFRIPNLPAGSYRLEAWHEYFGREEREIVVQAGETSALTIVYKETTTK